MGTGQSKKYTAPQQVESQWFPDFKEKLPSLEGKVIAVTGCTSGTGFVCAKTCAEKGAHVILLNRKSARADAAFAAIKEVAKGDVTNVECDLQSFASVAKAGETLVETLGKTGLDVLCNNAGVMALEDKPTEDKFDVQMQTNHLSHFKLTAACVPLLKTASELRGEARVVNHSSGARKFPGGALKPEYLGPNGGNLGGNGNSMFFGGARWVRYHHTKLANAVFTLALADKFKDFPKLKATCATPGLAATNLQVTTHSDGGMDSTWIMRWSQSGEDGTMPLLQCCVGSDVENGDLWEPNGVGNMTGPPVKVPFDSLSSDLKSRAMLWEKSEAACGPFPAI